MNSDTKICVFSLSKRDPTFSRAVSIKGSIEWLLGKKNPPYEYYFRGSKPNSMPEGSKILFSFQGQIFGEAIVKKGIQATSGNQDYYQHFLTLDPESIRIYHFYPSKEEIKEKIGYEYEFSQLFSYLTLQQYQQILKMAER